MNLVDKNIKKKEKKKKKENNNNNKPCRFPGSQQPPVLFWKVIRLSPVWKTIVKVTSSFSFFYLFLIPCADAFLFNLIVALSSSPRIATCTNLQAENVRPYLYYLTNLIMELYLLLQRQCVVDWIYWHSPKLLSSTSLVHVGIPHSSCGLYLSKYIS